MFNSPMRLYSSLLNELYRAAQAGDTEQMKVLLERGATVDTMSAGRRFLQQALSSCDLELMTLLFQRGVKVHDPYTAVECLQMAADDGDVQLIQLLLENGARAYVNDVIKDVDESALHLATRGGHEEAVHVLLSHCADVTAVTSTRRCTKQFEFYIDANITCLHIAAEEGYVDIVEELLDRKSEVNAVTSYGFTPLLLAVMENRLDVVRVLLDHGAWISPTTKFGETAHEMAENRNYVRISNVLEEHMKMILTETDILRMDYECEFVKYYIRKLKGKRKHRKYGVPTKYRRHLVESPTPERDQEVPNEDAQSSDGSEPDDASSIASGDSRHTVDSTLKATYGALGADSETDASSYVTVDESFDDEEWFGLDQEGADGQSLQELEDIDTDPFRKGITDPNESFRETHREEDTVEIIYDENIPPTEKDTDSHSFTAELDKSEEIYEHKQADSSDMDVKKDVVGEMDLMRSSEVNELKSAPETGKSQVITDRRKLRDSQDRDMKTDIDNVQDTRIPSESKIWRPAASATSYDVAKGEHMQLPDIVMKTNLESSRGGKNEEMMSSEESPIRDVTSSDAECEQGELSNDSLNVSHHSTEERPIFDGSVQFRPGKKNKGANRHSTGSIPSSKAAVPSRIPISRYTRRARVTKSLSAGKADYQDPSFDPRARYRTPNSEPERPAARSPFDGSSPRGHLDRSFNTFHSYERYMDSQTEDIPFADDEGTSFLDKSRDGRVLSQVNEKTQDGSPGGKDESEGTYEAASHTNYVHEQDTTDRPESAPQDNINSYSHDGYDLSNSDGFVEDREKEAAVDTDTLEWTREKEKVRFIGSTPLQPDRPETPPQETVSSYSHEGYRDGMKPAGPFEDAEKETTRDAGSSEETRVEGQRFIESTPLENEQPVTQPDGVKDGRNFSGTERFDKEEDGITGYDDPTVSKGHGENTEYTANGSEATADLQHSFESPGKATIKLALMYMSKKYGSGDSSDEDKDKPSAQSSNEHIPGNVTSGMAGEMAPEIKSQDARTRGFGDPTVNGRDRDQHLLKTAPDQSKNDKGATQTKGVVLRPTAVKEDYDLKAERENDEKASSFRVKDLIRPEKPKEPATNAKERKIRFSLPPTEDLPRQTLKETRGEQYHREKQETQDNREPDISRLIKPKEQANVEVEGRGAAVGSVTGDTVKNTDDVGTEATKKKKRKKKKGVGEAGVDKPRKVRKAKVIPERPKLPVQEDQLVETVVPEPSVLNVAESLDSDKTTRFVDKGPSGMKVTRHVEGKQDPTLPLLDPGSLNRQGGIPGGEIAGYRQPSEEDIVEAVSGTDQSEMIAKIDKFIMASISTLDAKYGTENKPANHSVEVQESGREDSTTPGPEAIVTSERASGPKWTPEHGPLDTPLHARGPVGSPERGPVGAPESTHGTVGRPKHGAVGAPERGPVGTGAPTRVPVDTPERGPVGAPERTRGPVSAPERTHGTVSRPKHGPVGSPEPGPVGAPESVHGLVDAPERTRGLLGTSERRHGPVDTPERERTRGPVRTPDRTHGTVSTPERTPGTVGAPERGPVGAPSPTRGPVDTPERGPVGAPERTLGPVSAPERTHGTVGRPKHGPVGAPAPTRGHVDTPERGPVGVPAPTRGHVDTPERGPVGAPAPTRDSMDMPERSSVGAPTHRHVGTPERTHGPVVMPERIHGPMDTPGRGSVGVPERTRGPVGTPERAQGMVGGPERGPAGGPERTRGPVGTPERGPVAAPERGPVAAPERTSGPVGAPERGPVGAPERTSRPVGAPERGPVGAPERGPVGAPERTSRPVGTPERGSVTAPERGLVAAPERTSGPVDASERAPAGPAVRDPIGSPVVASEVVHEGEIKKKKKKKKDGTKKLRRKKEKEHNVSHPTQPEVHGTSTPSPSSDPQRRSVSAPSPSSDPQRRSVSAPSPSSDPQRRSVSAPSPSSDPQRRSVCVTNLDDILTQQNLPDVSVEEDKNSDEPVSPTGKAKSVRTFVVTFVERSPSSDQEQLQSPVTREENGSLTTSPDRTVLPGDSSSTSPRGNRPTVFIEPTTSQVQEVPSSKDGHWDPTGGQVSQERKTTPKFQITETIPQLHDTHLERSPKTTPQGTEERDPNAGIWLQRANGSAGRFTWGDASKETPREAAVTRTSAPNLHYIVNTSGVQYEVQPGFKQDQSDGTRPTIEILPAVVTAPKIDLQPKRRRIGDAAEHPVHSPDNPEFRRSAGELMKILPVPEKGRRFGSSPKQDMNVGPRESAKKARPMSVPDVYVLVQFDKGNVSNFGVLEKDDPSGDRDSSTPNIAQSSSSRENLQQPARPEGSRAHRVKSLESLDIQAKERRPQRSLLPNPLPLSQVTSDSVDYTPYTSTSQEIQGNSDQKWRPRPAPRQTKSGRSASTPTYSETPRSSKHGKTEPRGSSRSNKNKSPEDKIGQRPLSLTDIQRTPVGQEQFPSGQYLFTGTGIDNGSITKMTVGQPSVDYKPSPKPRPQRPKLPPSPVGAAHNGNFSAQDPSISESPGERRQRPNSFHALPKENREGRHTIPIQASRPIKVSPKTVRYAEVPRTSAPVSYSGHFRHQMAPQTTPPGAQRPLVAGDAKKRLSDPTGSRPVHIQSRGTPPTSRSPQQLPSPKPSYEETDIW